MENRTGDPTQTYLAAGLAEDIARRLETEVIRRGAPVDLNGVQSRMLSADGDVRSACSLRRHGEEAHEVAFQQRQAAHGLARDIVDGTPGAGIARHVLAHDDIGESLHGLREYHSASEPITEMQRESRKGRRNESECPRLERVWSPNWQVLERERPAHTRNRDAPAAGARIDQRESCVGQRCARRPHHGPLNGRARDALRAGERATRCKRQRDEKYGQASATQGEGAAGRRGGGDD